MFFKRVEFITIVSYKSSLSGVSAKQACTVLAHVLALSALWLCVAFSAGVTIRSVLFSLSFFMIAYWLVSVFVYLFKKARYGTFTRMIQRFWKRALYLFWLLEIGLFGIYLFLTIISPQEVAYMLDNQQTFFFYNNNAKAFFESVLRPVTIILLANVYMLAHKYNTSKVAVSAALAALLVLALLEDFVQFYAASQHYSNYTWVHSTAEGSTASMAKYSGVWEQELAELKLRPYTHYLYLLTFLKLWHTFFIVYVFLSLENFGLYSAETSFNAISANMQNFYFLLFFSFILKVSYVKAYLNYLGTFVYFWFYTNYNLYDAGYFYELFSPDYVFFVVCDVRALF